MRSITRTTLITLLISGLLATGAALGQAGPALVNYQGVLRDNTDKPLTGSYGMVFYFMSAATSGVEIMIDSHTAAGGNAVTVTGGLFNVTLGGGTVTDGSGGGTYTSLASVFKDYAAVYLKIVVNGEELSSRPRIVAAAYAMNADMVDGQHGSGFVNTGSAAQTKTGPFVGDASAISASKGIHGRGTEAGGYFVDSDDGSWGYVGYGGMGVFGSGTSVGGWFANQSSNGYAVVGTGNKGISAAGGDMAGYFECTGASSITYIADGDQGIHAMGNECGGYFQNAAYGSSGFVAHGDNGVEGFGKSAGGYFEDTNGTGYGYIGYGDVGVKGVGGTAGGYFSDASGSGYALVGHDDIGIYGYGNYVAGAFLNSSDNSEAVLCRSNTGVAGYGRDSGAYFDDADSSGYAYVAKGDDGIDAYGNGSGGYFYDLNDSGNANVAYGQRGIWARGSFAGGTFSSLDNVTTWADVAKTNYKIVGTGAVSFVQNHPYDASRSIVYAAPEGDEVAVYTRGTARLVKGEARVGLGETFRWVANPDLGLTAHLTPHGDSRGLYVAALTTEELVVRENDGGASDVTFDFLVYGLRLGFEELAILQAKERDALPPTAYAIAKPYEGHEDLRTANALERYKVMRAAAGAEGEPDMTRSRALLAALEAQRAEAVARAIAEQPPRAAAPPEPPPSARPGMADLPGGPDQPPAPSGVDRQGGPATAASTGAAALARPPSAGHGSVGSPSQGGGSVIPGGEGERPVAAGTDAPLFAVSERVEPGDLLALDPDHPGQLKRASNPADPAVAGVAAAVPPATEGIGTVLMAGSLYTTVKVDASFNAILPGDLLTSSGTPGHAMKATAGTPAGTVIGKALERLDAGTGLIRILLMAR